MTAAELIGAAQAIAGSAADDDPSLPRRLDDLLDQLLPRLDATGEAAARAVVSDLLVQRCRLLRVRRELPVAGERIERPIIVMGEARSGTTVLQMLLGCDPGSRLLEFWEVMRPASPPSADERRRLGDDDWREILDRVPQWLVSHPYNGMLGRNPPECERLWAFDFRSLPPSAWWRVPGGSFPPVRLEQDHARQYALHRMVLQHLQHGAPPRRWVLKGTSHQLRLAALLDAYPDAVFVWIHRDPVQAIASRFELTAQIYEALGGGLDRAAFARHVVATGIANFAAAATDPVADDPRIHHLTYQHFVADPFGGVRAVYDRADLRFESGFGRRMRCWSAENPPGRYGRFTYSVDALGVDVAGLDAQLAPYRERFGVAREHPKET